MKDMQIWGGVLLVTGTTIGAGMLALPIVTGFAGFLPSSILIILFWIYLTFTAFLLLEVNLSIKEETHLITMAKKTLGTYGQVFGWIFYLFLLYTLTTAYMAGSAPLFLQLANWVIGSPIPRWLGPLPLIFLFTILIQGTKFIDYTNRILMIGLAIAFLALIISIAPHVQRTYLETANWPAVISAIPVISTSFGFHVIIPTLTHYLNRDTRKLKIVLFIGSVIPLVIYLIWELMTLGTIPLEGPYSLHSGYSTGANGAFILSHYLNEDKISQFATIFSLFAILTSFLGVSMSLIDFLADGLRIRKTKEGLFFLYFLAFSPPLFLTLTDPRAFLNALDYAGIFGVIVLLAIFPILMAWQIRYRQNQKLEFETIGGKASLILAFVISIGLIGIGIWTKLI